MTIPVTEINCSTNEKLVIRSKFKCISLNSEYLIRQQPVLRAQE